MTVRVLPTLAAMREVYELSTEGGPASPRFTRYVELGLARVPVAGYNPMTSKDVLGTIQSLLDIDAEQLLAATAADWAAPLGLPDLALSVTVATPGMWTDRRATEVEHRLLAHAWPSVLVWTGDDVTAETFVAAVMAQLVRAAWVTNHGPPATLADAAGQEGLAAAMTDEPGRADADVAEALEVFGADTALGTMVAVLDGDDAAISLGWTPLGIGPDAGRGHCAAAARAALDHEPVGDLVRARWSPALVDR